MPACMIIAAMYRGEEAEFLFPGPLDCLICADRGYEAARKAGLTPDLVVGDFDSMPRPDLPPEKLLVLPVHKDDTDTAVALEEGRRRGYREFRVGGGLGGRLDPTMANLQLAADCALRGERMWLCDPQNMATVLAPGSYALPWQYGRKLSLLAFTERVGGVCLRGTEWPLEGAVLESRRPLGVSNEWKEASAILSFESGLLAVFFSGDA